MEVKKEYLTKHEVGELLGLSLATVNRLIDAGELAAMKIFGSVRISRGAVDKLVANNMKPKKEQDGKRAKRR